MESTYLRPRWDYARFTYKCSDGNVLLLPHQHKSEIRINNSLKIMNGQLSNGIIYYRNLQSQQHDPETLVSKTALNREISALLRCSTASLTYCVPETVTNIARYAFKGAALLHNVKVPAGLREIGEGCFVGSGLTSLRLPAPMPKLNNGTLYSRRPMTIYIPDGLQTIQGSVFTHTGVGRIVIPPSVSEIQDAAFEHCSNLTHVVIPDDSRLQKIGERAFSQSELKSFISPCSLREIGVMAFFKCYDLYEVELNEDLEALGGLTFWGTGVTSLKIPVKVAADAQALGINYRHVKVLRLPETMKTVTKEQFANTYIQQLVVPANVKRIGENGFWECQALTQMTFCGESSLEEIQFGAFGKSGLEKFTAPPVLREIYQAAFFGCKSLRHVELNDHITVLGKTAAPEQGGRYCGVFEDSAVEEVRLGSGLKVISHDVFRNCQNLKVLDLPDSLEVIEEGCFQDSGLQRITIPANTIEIQKNAFRDCGDLITLSFADSKKTVKIGNAAFQHTSLTFVVIPRIAQLAQDAFDAATCVRLTLY